MNDRIRFFDLSICSAYFRILGDVRIDVQRFLPYSGKRMNLLLKLRIFYPSPYPNDPSLVPSAEPMADAFVEAVQNKDVLETLKKCFLIDLEFTV